MYQYSGQSRWRGKMFHLQVPATVISIELLWLQSREHAAHNSNNISCSNVNKAIWLELIPSTSTLLAQLGALKCPVVYCSAVKTVGSSFAVGPHRPISCSCACCCCADVIVSTCVCSVALYFLSPLPPRPPRWRNATPMSLLLSLYSRAGLDVVW